MASYRLSNQAKEDLIRIYQYGRVKFGERQAEKYFNQLFDMFDSIAERPKSFEAVDHIKSGYRRCVCGVDSIFFKEQDGFVDIIAIVGRQDVNQIFK